MPEQLVIGVTGPFGAGRSEISKHLEGKGFEVVRLSDVIREEAAARCQNALDVEGLQNLGDELRNDYGGDVLARRALEKASASKVVLDGVKNPGEVTYLDVAALFYMIGVDASRESRKRRVVGVGPGKVSEEEFERVEARDRAEVDAFGVPVETGQQVDKCVRMSHFLVWNDKVMIAGTGPPSGQDGARQSAIDKVDRMLYCIDQPQKSHPIDAELLMAQAVVASRGSQCLQRRVGAVVASTGGRLLAAGRNNAPAPLKSCREQFGMCNRRMVRDEFLADAAKRFVCASCAGKLSLELKCEKCGADHRGVLDRFRNLDLCRALHAEDTALLQMANGSRGTQGEIHLYTTTFPCLLCANKVVHAGVQKVIFIDPYPGDDARDALEGSATRVEHFEGYTLKGLERVWGEVSM